MLVGDRVRLEPLTVAVLDDYLTGLADPEVRRLTGTTATFEREAVERWLRTRRDCDDRADWAVLRRRDGAFLGEAVLNDVAAGSANYRVWLAVPGRGYGTEVTRLVVSYALGAAGLRRVRLGVYAFNERARRTYQRCGFTHDGRRARALLLDGTWHDELLMSVP